MHLYDWQTQCSTLAEDGRLVCKVKRLMPTVGCEADSVAFTEEERITGMQSGSKDSAPLFAADGSYTIPADFGSGGRAQAEHCLSTGEGQRLRIVHVFRDLKAGWALSEIEIHRESREGPYNGGKELAGCGGGMPSFAEKDRLSLQALEGEWVAVEGSTLQRGLGPDSEQSWKDPDALRLPLDVWSSVTESGDSLSIRLGCLFSDDRRYSAAQLYEARKPVGVRLALEKRQ